MKICITGSSGLIGSSAVRLFTDLNHQVIGIDNGMRSQFFGEGGSTKNQENRQKKIKNFEHLQCDIRSKEELENIFKTHSFDAVIHCAGQPSHDKAKEILEMDLSVNLLGTVNLLQVTYKYSPEAVFIFTSTNKVYGDTPNNTPFIKGKTRYLFKDQTFLGFDENCSIDQSTHSFFGASKLGADIYTQEFGRYLGLKTSVLRLGCVTGAHHASVKLHGFLSYLIKSLVKDNVYEIIGYEGKQVRDQIHADDVAQAFLSIVKNPHVGEVFNLGGGQENNASVLEIIEMVKAKLKTNPKISYEGTPRIGDHICYISDIRKFRRFYPEWKLSRDISSIVDEIIEYEQKN